MAPDYSPAWALVLGSAAIAPFTPAWLMTLEDKLGEANLSVNKAARAYTWIPTEKNLKALVKACRKYKKLYKKVMLPLHPDLPPDVANFHRETTENWLEVKKLKG